MGMKDKEKYTPGASGEKMPKGVLASDMSGEKKESVKGGVGMGKMDACGADKQFKGGSSEKVCYEHKRASYDLEDKYEGK
jgi:hypothetical protein